MTNERLKVFTAIFETDEGMMSASFDASNLRTANKMLKSAFPHDHGADGFWTDEDGNETPINW